MLGEDEPHLRHPAAFQPPQAAYEPRLGELGQRSFELMVSI